MRRRIRRVSLTSHQPRSDTWCEAAACQKCLKEMHPTGFDQTYDNQLRPDLLQSIPTSIPRRCVVGSDGWRPPSHQGTRYTRTSMLICPPSGKDPTA
ncbi:hypothetical protein TIFTF001_008372 [Ficus carica]|uniref:Uncharacterized protein n=1 Tax=Ficus carica TaxID=3494 RepID=A0AA87ZMY8_FICCA|nr:hypothetical protein TIFTF001_008372 [Ficus carica]